jgi:hypothetical protein
MFKSAGSRFDPAMIRRDPSFFSRKKEEKNNEASGGASPVTLRHRRIRSDQPTRRQWLTSKIIAARQRRSDAE